MWPWTIEEYNFVSQNKKTADAFSHKMKRIALDITDMQVDLASKMFGLVNKHTDNLFDVYENVYNKQVTEYRNYVRSMYKE